jgi:hypothetical protein
MTNDTTEKRRWLRTLSELTHERITRIEDDQETIERQATERRETLQQ